MFFLGSTQENLVFYESCFSEDEWRLVFYQKVSQTIEIYREMTKVESLTYVFYDRCGTGVSRNTIFYDAIALLHFRDTDVALTKSQSNYAKLLRNDNGRELNLRVLR